MAQRREHQRVDVFQAYVETTLEQRAYFSSEDKRLSAARRAAITNVFRRWCVRRAFGVRGQNEADSVVLHMRRDRHGTNDSTDIQNLLAVENGLDRDIAVLRGAIENIVQFFALGKRNAQLEKKAVELRFRQRIRAFHFERILRGDDKKGFVEQMRYTGD